MKKNNIYSPKKTPRLHMEGQVIGQLQEKLSLSFSSVGISLMITTICIHLLAIFDCMCVCVRFFCYIHSFDRIPFSSTRTLAQMYIQSQSKSRLLLISPWCANEMVHKTTTAIAVTHKKRRHTLSDERFVIPIRMPIYATYITVHI